MNNITIIPFFDSLGPQALKFVINQTGLSTMFIEVGAIKSFVKLAKAQEVPTLKAVVCYDAFTDEQKKEIEDTGLKIYAYKDLLTEGEIAKPTKNF